MEQTMELLNLISDRRSCRDFLPQPPDRSALASVVEAGRCAPSAMNQQLCRFYVITDPEILADISRTVSAQLERYAGRDCRYGAPALILVTNRKDNGCALQDASCAMENMMLAARALGLGSCWINQPYHLRDNPELRALLAGIGLSDEELICASLALGRPAGPLPGRRDHPGNAVIWVTKD